jgi:type IX secretion system PorP/SprF family membrane protein
VFSQYYFSPSNLNPALAGLEKNLMVGANHRSQWRDLQVPYAASLLTFNYPFYIAKPNTFHAGGLAFSVSQETAGPNQLFRSLRGQFSGAYNLQLDNLNRNTLSFGLQGGFVRTSLDGGQLQWGSQYNELIGYDAGISPSLGNLIEQNSYPSVSTGMVWHHRTNYKRPSASGKNVLGGFLGISAANLNRPNTAHFTDQDHQAPLIYSAHGGLEHQLKRVRLSHQALYIKAGSAYHLNLGTYVTYPLKSTNQFSSDSPNLLLGVWYRIEDALVVSTGIQAGKITAALSYDFNTNANPADNTLSGGAYEVSVMYRLPKKVDKKQYGIPLM